jgi:two-component system NarL family response regulator
MTMQRTASNPESQTAEPQSASKTIRILVADDHLVYRIGIRSMIGSEPGLTVVGEASDGVEAIESYRRLQPDVLLLDLRMPQKGGVEVVQAIRKEFNNARILIVTSYQTEEEIFQVLQAGVLGYILKDLGRDALIEAIRAVCAGKRWMSSAIERQFADRGLRQPLTGREMEVLKLLARGLTNREIAQVFHISSSTVKNHVNSLLTKLEVADRTEAVSFCLSHGLIRPEDL